MADLELLNRIQQFIYREARLADAHEYDAWESLWADDGVYWIPANGHDIDPETQMSLVYDNRSRIALRIKQLKTGKRHAQEPRSGLGRVVSNIEILDDNGTELTTTCMSCTYESSLGGEVVWMSRNEYILRRDEDAFKIVRKKVMLVNHDQPLLTLSFLI